MPTGRELQQNFEFKWGAFRKFIAAHPLTGFWSGVGAGAVLGAFAVWVL